MKQLSLQKTHLSLDAKMVDFAGFEMPLQYPTGLSKEHLAVRENMGIFDVSHMGEFMVEGPSALGFIQKVTSNDASKLHVGMVQYSTFPNESAGIIDDLLVYKLAEDRYMLVVNAGNIQKDWDWLQLHKIKNTVLTNRSESIGLLAVQGPKSINALQNLTDIALNDIPYYSFIVGTFAGIPHVIMSHTGYTGAGGLELYVPNESLETAWNAIIKEGAAPCGLGCRDSLRMEKAFCLYGNDIDDHTHLLEAGLGWITQTSKEFIGKDAFLAKKTKGIQQKLVAFIMLEKGIPRSHYTIVDAQGNTIGTVTSGMQSPLLNKGMGMGYVSKAFSQLKQEIYIQIRNKNLKAMVVKSPLESF